MCRNCFDKNGQKVNFFAGGNFHEERKCFSGAVKWVPVDVLGIKMGQIEDILNFFQKRVDFVCKGRYNMELYENNEKGDAQMANIKSSKKDVISSKIAYEKNKANKSELKTNLKKFDAALESGDKTVAEAAYKVAVKSVDQAVIKGLLHKNNAARKKSALTLKLNKLG